MWHRENTETVLIKSADSKMLWDTVNLKEDYAEKAGGGAGTA